MTLTVFLQYCLAGISIGGIYALIAIGYTMVYGILRLINFAHGDIFMMAAYFMIFAMVDFAIPWYISMIIMIIAGNCHKLKEHLKLNVGNIRLILLKDV